MLADRRLLPLFAFAVAAVAQAPGPPSSGLAPVDDEEHFLLTAQIESVTLAGKGTTNSKKALLNDGTRRHFAHIQTVDMDLPEFRGKDGSAELDFKDTWKFNVAAYRLARLLHLTSMVPVSVARPFEGKPAAFTWWIDDVVMDERERAARQLHPPDIPRWNRQMDTIRIFDQLIYNMDRSQENMLLTADWSVWMIDHTRAFRKWRVLRNPTAVTHCDPGLLERLKDLQREDVAGEMGELLTAEEIDGLMARRDLIVAKLEAEAPAGAAQ